MDESLFNKIKKIKGIRFLLLAIGIGVFLLIYATWQDKTVPISSASEHSSLLMNNTLQTYTENLETSLENLIRNVSGVSNPQVLITLDCSEENLFAMNNGAEGSPVILDNGNQSLVTQKIVIPVIRGVGVVCQGGSNPTIQNKLTLLISSALGISTSSIYVTE